MSDPHSLTHTHTLTFRLYLFCSGYAAIIVCLFFLHSSAVEVFSNRLSGTLAKLWKKCATYSLEKTIITLCIHARFIFVALEMVPVFSLASRLCLGQVLNGFIWRLRR